MSVQTQEVQIILTIKTIQISKKLNYRKAAKIYKIPETILYNKINSVTFLFEYRLANTNLNKLKEQIIVNYILDQDFKRFFPW